MRRRLTFPNKLFLLFIFSMVAVLSFLAFKNMEDSSAVNAAYNGFQAGNIISDYVMGDHTTMSETEIKSFLKSKNSCNDTNLTKNSLSHGYVTAGNQYGVTYNYQLTYSGGTYYYHVVDGHFVCMADETFNGETAAHIIWQAAQDYKINPRVLIVLLEKEQGLVSDTWPNTTLEYRSATGYGCPDTAACDSSYYGFKNQVRNAAELFRYILDYGSKYYPVGNNTIKYNPDSSCGSSTVYIENRATSALYQYTPYQPNAAVLNATPGTTVTCGAYGNANFYRLFTSWFGDTHTTVSTVNFPSDVFNIKVSSGKYLVPASNAAGSKLVISSSATEANRQFKFTKSGNFYVITHVASGLVLELADSNTSNGATIQLAAAGSGNNQKWRFAVSGSGYTIRSACSDSMVFDVPGNAVDTEGTAIQLYLGNNSNAQRFTVADVSTAPVANGTYVIETMGGKSIDIDGGKTANGTGLLTYNPTYNNHQQTTLERGTDGLYTLKNTISGRVFDVAAGSTSDGAAVQIYDSNGSCAQKWIVEASGSGYRFLSSCSGKAIDIPGNRTSVNLQRLQIYTANNTNAQTFLLRTLNPLADGNYKISSSVGSNFVMDISGGAENSKNGTNINIYTSNNTNAQKFKVTYNSSAKAYSIINTTANRSVDVSAASGASGANVQVWGSNSTCAQLWHLRPSTNGTYNIISACSDKVLDVSGAAAKNGANIQIYDLNNTNAQKWTFTAL